MPTRVYWIPALVLWIASMGWLVSTKLVPALTTGSPPDYQAMLPKTAVKNPEPVRWSIRWNGKEIGQAENKISRAFDGTGRIASLVQFEQLPVDQMVRDTMGILGSLATAMTADIGPLDLTVSTDLHFDNYGQLGRFETSVDVSDLENLLNIQGTVHDETLDLSARIKTEENKTSEVYRKRNIKLPPDAMVADTFSPRPKLADLRVGQTWTFQSYQPLMPYSPLTLIEARVVGEELVEWNGTMSRAKKVVFQRDSGSGISTTRRPVSETWVLKDGTVLRQDLWLANVKVQFIREPDETTGSNELEESGEDSPVQAKDETAP